MEIRRVAVKLLGLPKNAYLRGLFGERRNPLYTRLYYVLSAEEAREMEGAVAIVEDRGARVRGMIYDSLLLEHE
eukprot:9230282-Lingulodinium_polyedra.AAC.1